MVLTIQWFQSTCQSSETSTRKYQICGFVTILVDARLPLSSQNPMLTKIVGDKPKLLILNKADLADSDLTKEWRRYFWKSRYQDLGNQFLKSNQLLKKSQKQLSHWWKKELLGKERGIQIETLRTMIISIPNAGKSTLMNRLAGKNRCDWKWLRCYQGGSSGSESNRTWKF